MYIPVRSTIRLLVLAGRGSSSKSSFTGGLPGGVWPLLLPPSVSSAWGGLCLRRMRLDTGSTGSFDWNFFFRACKCGDENRKELPDIIFNYLTCKFEHMLIAVIAKRKL